MKVKLHPLFFVLVLALIAFGQALNFAWTILALLLHESAHAVMARLRGFTVKKLVMMPYGAMMSMGENFDRTSSILIGLAGPVANILLALVVLGVWWLFPSAYGVTQPFFYANMTLGLFNLLPVYPLDGSRVALGVAKNRLKALKGLQIAGIAASMAFFALFIASLFFKFNLSLGVIAVFLFYGAAFGTKEEMYISVLDGASKNYSLGVEKKRVAISAQTPIVRLYHHISSTCDVTFDVVDESGRAAATIGESELKRVALKNKLSTPIGDALSIPATRQGDASIFATRQEKTPKSKRGQKGRARA